MVARAFAMAVSASQAGIALSRILHPFEKRFHQILSQRNGLQPFRRIAAAAAT